MKIAFVKQEIYSDLYVCANRTPIDELLFSSMVRVGPFGLFAHLDADFLIVKEDKAKECHAWETELSKDEKASVYRELKTKPLNQLEGNEYWVPGSDKAPGEFAVDVDEVDWSKYDIVISINISVPTRIVVKYPKTLWVHMSGESQYMRFTAYYRYDLALTQMSRCEYNRRLRVLEFPYTFIGSTTLEDVIKKYTDVEKKDGIFGEINCVTERPVRCIPQFDPIVEATGHQIKYHHQLISDNLKELYSAKYYLKIGGRPTRGNGAIEAISLGTPILMSPEDVIHRQILPAEAFVFSAEDAIKKIEYLDSHEDEYQALLRKERELLQTTVYDYPLYGLLKAAEEKNGRVNKKFPYMPFVEKKFLNRLAKLF